MCDNPDWKDKNVEGINPCGEQCLESYELCCLVETFPSHHDSYEEFEETLKYAYLYAKSATLLRTHWKETNKIMLKNRRIGVSQTGITNSFEKFGRHKMIKWCKDGYEFLKNTDKTYSNWLCIPRSIKITTVKPSGTVSILGNVNPGIHYPHSEYYIRRVRISKDSDLIDDIIDSGYKVEKDSYSPNTLVIEFPVKVKNFGRSKSDVSMWEQVENASMYQKYWSDNQVSITVTFTKEESKNLQYLLECCENKLKSISMLPITNHGYEQAPYEKITKNEYKKMISKIDLKELRSSQNPDGERFCDSDSCQIKIDK
jgi:adenosylcobalamin-dependent ribonucleoside-triphosphate reductase